MGTRMLRTRRCCWKYLWVEDKYIWFVFEGKLRLLRNSRSGTVFYVLIDNQNINKGIAGLHWRSFTLHATKIDKTQRQLMLLCFEPQDPHLLVSRCNGFAHTFSPFMPIHRFTYSVFVGFFSFRYCRQLRGHAGYLTVESILSQVDENQ